MCPGRNATSAAGTPRACAARATLSPLPPAVTITLARRTTSPGRSSGSVEVRSTVRFGPAMSKGERMSAGGVRQVAGENHGPRLLRGGGGVERHDHGVVGREPLRELLDILVARAGRGERAIGADGVLG